MRRYRPDDDRERDLMRQRQEQFTADLTIGLATLTEHGRWTPIGHDFFTDLRRTAR